MNVVMNYIVMLPNDHIIKFDDGNYVTEYIQEYYTQEMERDCKETGIREEELSASNVEDMTNLLGGTDQICKIYDFDVIIDAIKDAPTDDSHKQGMIKMMSNLEIELPIRCPGDISDIITGAQEIYAHELLD